MIFHIREFVLTLIVCSLGIVLHRCTGSYFPPLDSLKEALNTKEKIWLKKRTYNQSGIMCVHITKRSLSGNHYNFSLYYRNGSKPMPSHFYSADLSDSEEGPVMIVRQTGSQYTLKYINENERCGIVTITKSDEECEQYVLDDGIDIDTPQCDAVYYDNCKNKTYKVYKNGCR
uniref:Lipocalin n=1 Tax=Rhipicephalus appendiculatus TaxID=34631 RepID=A0A131YTR0_RHIAP